MYSISDTTSKQPKEDWGYNVLGTELEICSSEPLTGYFRDGFCATGVMDTGIHVVCAKVNTQFLEYTKNQGNDLSTPMPIYNFPGLKDGDKWCLCAARWREAMDAGVAPQVDLKATNQKALDYLKIEDLKAHKIRK